MSSRPGKEFLPNLPPAGRFTPMPGVVWAALEILSGRTPTFGLPRDVEELPASVLCRRSERDEDLESYRLSDLQPFGLTIEDERLLGDFGGVPEPTKLAEVQLGAIWECLSVLCDLGDYGTSPVENRRLNARIAFACLDELARLVDGYLSSGGKSRSISVA